MISFDRVSSKYRFLSLVKFVVNTADLTLSTTSVRTYERALLFSKTKRHRILNISYTSRPYTHLRLLSPVAHLHVSLSFLKPSWKYDTGHWSLPTSFITIIRAPCDTFSQLWQPKTFSRIGAYTKTSFIYQSDLRARDRYNIYWHTTMIIITHTHTQVAYLNRYAIIHFTYCIYNRRTTRYAWSAPRLRLNCA